MGGGWDQTPMAEVLANLQYDMSRNIATLEALKTSLEERYEEVAQVEKPATESKASSPRPVTDQIFIVHGHTREAESVARLLTQLGLKPIILHEQPNLGMTVIEKFERNADVGFAVVLLTPDDECTGADGKVAQRARQNVILELGYFVGKLGRSRICALKQGDVELPSDIFGLVWTPLDQNGGWRFLLAKELKAAGYPIDFNQLNS